MIEFNIKELEPRYLSIKEALDWINNTLRASDITNEQKFYAIENFFEGPKNPWNRLGCTFSYKTSF